MEQLLPALGGMLLKAIPTILIVLLLHWYLKAMLFKPLQKVLAERDALTIGAKKRAQETLKLADTKAAEFERAIVQARAEIYRDQETKRKEWMGDQAEQVRTARAGADKSVSAARADLDRESAEARENLKATSEGLADEIARTILGRGAHA